MKKIIIADDDPAICDSIQLVLEDEGYEVHSVSDQSLIATVESYMPDLLLLDLWMSGENGQDICKELKKNQKTKHIPVIIVSASNTIGVSVKEAGADDFIEKPFALNTLLTKVAKWTGSSDSSIIKYQEGGH